MKKQGLSITANVLSLLALFLLFSSFIMSAHPAAVVETKQSFWQAVQGFSVQKLGFWQKTAVTLAGTSAFFALYQRKYQRQYHEGMGCLHVLGIIILIPIVILLAPILLVIGLFMLILGIPFPRFGERRHHERGRRRRYERY